MLAAVGFNGRELHLTVMGAKDERKNLGAPLASKKLAKSLLRLKRQTIPADLLEKPGVINARWMICSNIDKKTRLPMPDEFVDVAVLTTLGMITERP